MYLYQLSFIISYSSSPKTKNITTINKGRCKIMPTNKGASIVCKTEMRKKKYLNTTRLGDFSKGNSFTGER